MASISDGSEPARNALARQGSYRLSRALSLAVEAGLWILLISTPLAIGSVSQTASVLMEGACLTLLTSAWWADLRQGSSRVPRSFKLAATAFVVWSIVQTVPLPLTVLAWVSPGTHRLYQQNLPGYASSEGSADLQTWLSQRHSTPSKDLEPRSGQSTGLEGKIPIRVGWKPISWYPERTLHWIARFIAYWALFLLVVDFLPERACRRRLPWLLSVLGFGLALLAIIQKLTWNGKIYWFIPVYQGKPFGPWVNPNHFASYMEMTLAIGAALLVDQVRGGSTRRRRSGHTRSLVPRAILVIFFLLGMVAALLVSGSRGGLFSVLLTGATFWMAQVGFAEPKGGSRWRNLLLGILPLLLIGAGVGAYTLRPSTLKMPSEETGVEPSFGTRINAWKGLLTMVASNPVAGTGLGTFGLAYPVFKTYGSTEIWDKAHNDYLQVLSESGIPGFALLLFGLGSLASGFLVPALRRPWKRQDPLALGAALGCLSLLIHALVEFNFQIPANGLLFVLVGGLLVRFGSSAPPGASASRGGRSRSAEDPETLE